MQTGLHPHPAASTVPEMPGAGRWPGLWRWLPMVRPSWRPWLNALLVAAVAIALRAAVQPLLGEQLPFVVAYPATTLVALLCGAGPGLLTALLCGVAVGVQGIPPNLTPAEVPVQLGAFGLVSLATCLFFGAIGRRSAFGTAVGAAGSGDTPLTLWLRAVLWGALLIPLATFALAAWWGYDRAVREARESVAHASALALRHAERTLNIAEDIGRRADSVASASDADVRAREAAVHQRLNDLVAGLPSIVNLNVWDANGRALARSDTVPVDTRASVADRAYFHEQRDSVIRVGISEVLKGRQTGLSLFNLSLRRTSDDGSFRGVIAVSLAPAFFQDYYRSLTADDPLLASFALTRTDGTLLARWPAAPDGRTTVPTGSLMLARVQAGELEGSAVLPASAGRETRLTSFRRLPGYPVYVVAGVSWAGVLSGWYRFMALLAAAMVPITAGLVIVSWVALQKTRREQAMAAELQQQIERRATVERAMVESQKLATLAQLTGGVAHDFNNLLAIVGTSLHVHRRAHPELVGERPLQAMERAVRSGIRLTRQLLSFSRRQALSPEIIRLQDWLPATADLLRTTLNRNIQLDYSVDANTHAIKADAAELELALINTALNAQHAMPGGGRLQVLAENDIAAPGAHSHGHTHGHTHGQAHGHPPERASGPAAAGQRMVRITVRDDGTGIAPEPLRKVFEPFFTTKPAGTGSGLGLTQVHGLCTQAGGFATITSTLATATERGGTSVHLFFPAVTASVLPPGGGDALASLAPSMPDLQGTVLLVEDNDDVAVATETLLRSAGLQVARAASAQQALDHLARSGRAPDVVLSDISMPGNMDGIALAFVLRERWPALPVLLTTGYAERLQDAVIGGLHVLAKPAPPDQLLAAVGAMLARADAAVG